MRCMGRQTACGITTIAFPKSQVHFVASAALRRRRRQLMIPDDAVACALPFCRDALHGLSILFPLWLFQSPSSPYSCPRPPRHHLPCTPSPCSDASESSESRAQEQGALLRLLPLVSPRGPIERSWPLLTEAKGALCGARPLGLLPIQICVAGPSHASPSWAHMLRGPATAAVCCFRVWVCPGKNQEWLCPQLGCVSARVGFCLM